MSDVGYAKVRSRVWRNRWQEGSRSVVREVPVALIYDGGTEAVMMATPADLEEFALGFSFTERIVNDANEIAALEIEPRERGVEIRMGLVPGMRERLITRRRLRAGPAGCGLCGIESLEQALPQLTPVTLDSCVSASSIMDAMKQLEPQQLLNLETKAVHAAGFMTLKGKVIAVREDVGRHNALDKLCGYLIKSSAMHSDGVVLMTSRVSVELVQKVAVMGVPVLAAISAPTSLAIEEAEKLGICVVGVVRPDGLEVFSHAERVC